MLEGEGFEEVESFRYLSSIVDTRGGIGGSKLN